MRYQAAWEEVAITHWGCPYKEVRDALQAAAQRWQVTLDDAAVAYAAMNIHAGIWE